MNSRTNGVLQRSPDYSPLVVCPLVWIRAHWYSVGMVLAQNLVICADIMPMTYQCLIYHTNGALQASPDYIRLDRWVLVRIWAHWYAIGTLLVQIAGYMAKTAPTT